MLQGKNRRNGVWSRPISLIHCQAHASQDTDDDETETTEESPCGRWLKRREEIKYRDVPGIDTSFLAMDSEEGVEVSVAR